MKQILSALLLSAAAVLSALNYADYGAGPMLKPNRTFYVSQKGNDKNDGLSEARAFRSIKRGVRALRTGDSLLIDEGIYFEGAIEINVKDNSLNYALQCGKPGSPIRIMGMKGKKVILSGGAFLKAVKRSGQLAEFHWAKEPNYNMVQELPSGIELQRVASEELVRKFPGTFLYDKAKKRLLVHFAALEQTGVSVAQHRIGIRIHGSYIHLENLEFRHYYEGIYTRANRPYDKNAASHITIEKCNFFRNYHCGVVMDGCSWSLLKNNRGAFNTKRGNFMNLKDAHDNIYLGNWSGPTTQTLRHLERNGYNFGINSYGGNPPRNHVIGNFVESENSLRWKGGGPGSIVRDNIFLGRFHAESKQIPAVINNNVFAKSISYFSLGWGIWEKEFASSPIKFYGNVRKVADFKALGKEILKAQKLKISFPAPKFPKVEFKNLKLSTITADSATVTWQTPENDGWGDLQYWQKGSKKRRWQGGTGIQSVEHAVGISNLTPNTEYCFKAFFRGRRDPSWRGSEIQTFRSAAKNPAPRILEVGKGKLSLFEAGCAARAGDTIKLLPGTHTGQLFFLFSGTREKPITVTGNNKATIDGANFYAPLTAANFKSHIIIEGITFANPDPAAGKHVIRLRGGSDITVRNCRTRLIPWTAGGFVCSNNTPHLEIRNNVIHGCDYPINLNRADKAKIINNTIVDATMLTVLLWNPVDVEIRNNIFYRPCVESKRNPALLLQNIQGKIVSDGNVYWSSVKGHPAGGVIRDKRAKVLFRSQTLEEWQKKTGMDKKSISADPLFVDYQKGDFRLKPGSPAKGKGANL